MIADNSSSGVKTPTDNRKPVIGITCGRLNLSADAGEIQAVITGCDTTYVDAVCKSGGVPVLFPVTADPGVVSEALDSVDGLILGGGGDLVSLTYGEEPHAANKFEDPDRDYYELELARLAFISGKPILCICRGMQVLNVALGGTLVQDIPSLLPGAFNHYQKGLATFLCHSVEINEGSLQAALFGTTKLAVNSTHHQSVKEPGKNLNVVSRAPDGVIEGLEAAGGKPVLAIQFHPERLIDKYPLFLQLFDWLVKEATARRT